MPWHRHSDYHCMPRLEYEQTAIFHCSICSHLTTKRIYDPTPYVPAFYDHHIEPDCSNCGHIHDFPSCLPPPALRPILFFDTQLQFSGPKLEPPPHRCRRYIFTPVYICWSCDGVAVDFISAGSFFSSGSNGETVPSWDACCQRCRMKVDSSWRAGWSVVMYERDESDGALYLYDELPGKYEQEVVIEELEVTEQLRTMRRVPGYRLDSDQWNAWEWRHFVGLDDEYSLRMSNRYR